MTAAGYEPPRQSASLGEHFEIMQLDANMGLITAVHELLVQCRGETIRLVPAIPWRWRDLSFDRIRAVGGFEIGATVRAGKLIEVRVHATADGRLRLQHGLDAAIVNESPTIHGMLLERECVAGERLVIRAPG